MSPTLAQSQVEQLKKEGYSEKEIAYALKALNEQGISQEALEQLDQQSRYEMGDPLTGSQPSSFISQRETDLSKWQLELNDILERAEHILRGDIPKYEKGVLIWSKNPDMSENPLNEKGIREITKILVMYINRNTILSDYSEKEISLKVYDFGKRLSDAIFMSYDTMGLDTEEKRKAYATIVGELVDMVHSSFKRALHGGERRSLREMINIQQSSSSPMYSDMGGGMHQRERSVLNPNRYLKGKYVQ
jgi:hypothetical protein